MKTIILFLLTFLCCSLTACKATAKPASGNEDYFSLGQLFQADLDQRPLTQHEQSYMAGSVNGVLGYVAHQQLMGWADHAFVCVEYSQRLSITPEWLKKTMIQDALDNPALGSNDKIDVAVVVAYTLAKHFPCKNAPKYNPEGFSDAVDLSSLPAKPAATMERQ